jgi:hypothetical protein
MCGFEGVVGCLGPVVIHDSRRTSCRRVIVEGEWLQALITK